MNALSMTDMANALQAATAVAQGQSYPEGSLYLVATPIGNLADISLRALHVLQMVDVVACEDTRHTQTLLRAWGIQRPANQLLAVHQHNEQQAAQTVVQRLRLGLRVAYVSDAGTPAISDPGARLVQAVQAGGLRTIPVPGASSVITALSASGVDAVDKSNGVTSAAGGWLFAGFLPTKGRERQQALAALQAQQRAVVLLEAPHRISNLCQDISVLGERQVTLARELTKQFESIKTMPAKDLSSWLQEAIERKKGEFVVVIHPQSAHTVDIEKNVIDQETERVLHLLLAELPVKTAVRLCAEITGAPRNSLYTHALTLRQKNTYE